MSHHQRGQLAEAETLYRKILAITPHHGDALHYAGVAALQQGRHQDAADLIEKSLALRERNAEAHYHLGLAMAGLHRFEETASHNRRAIAIKPDYLDAHMNLGNALKALGRLDEAADRYRHIIALNPDLAAAHYNLANVLVDRSEFEAAIDSFERALAAQPNFLQARQNLATTLLARCRFDEAIAQFRAVLAAKPDFAEALLGQALALAQKGDAQAALGIVLSDTLAANPSADAKALFVECVAGLTEYSPIAGLQDHLIAAITKPWTRPRKLAGFAALVLRATDAVAAIHARAAAAGENFTLSHADLEALASEHLLLAVLENAAVVDQHLEHILTAARRALLAMAAGNPDAAGDAILGFACALARQCFINEYAFDLAEEEIGRAHALCERVGAALDAAQAPPPLTIAVVAAYFPLHGLAGADRLLARPWPAAVDALLTQQLREPAQERELRDAMPQLTPIEDDVSLKVQRQYEENPYPRWVKLAQLRKPVPLDAFVQKKLLPHAPLRPTGKATCDILVAGCGTGQHPLDLALNIAGAKILAVDLSRASLAHAQRKTRELGIETIDYAQADILKLAKLDRTFDCVVAVGVLHHMADPFAAGRALMALLRPGGLMMLSFYSKAATPHVLAARAFVAAQGFATTADGIRRARRAIMALPDGELVKEVVDTADFFSTSECRDLLFHVQEQRLTIPQIKAFIDDTGFEFLGFNLTMAVASRYMARFPQDPTLTDLDNWHAFEAENPHSFLSMYDFVLRKPGGQNA